eukprot:gnl/MRDRNA2_/MRDRNA2_96109_c0_seq1.p2 gnl/MRDRNA2_/MRDRNA2_96109_c0~~gnl/MRDRNA2_/MRDRNA2_96109_c0_seq1.p2  ORF type:complete len:176 (+),score=40.37 gnl/MRDRNA2_/MRDRNA2_96109_c0_seq1:116-643(+)
MQSLSLLVVWPQVMAVALRGSHPQAGCWSAEELNVLAARLESEIAPDYRALAVPPERFTRTIAKGLLRELHKCTGGSVLMRDAPASHTCGELAKGVAAPPKDDSQCNELAEQRARAAAEASIAVFATKHGVDGWRHAAYMPQNSYTLQDWRDANPITPLHEDEAPVETDKLKSFH